MTLYEDDRLKMKASLRETNRIREFYLKHRALETGEVHPQGHECKNCKRWRAELAEAWPPLAEKLGLPVPGANGKPLHLTKYETEEERRRDCARTRIRHFEQGPMAQHEWVIIGIEATICDRVGLALPGRAYQEQQRLDL